MEKTYIALNETILKNYQSVYPNLKDFSYDVETDTLIYQGNRVFLNGYGLSRIDPVFFALNPEDIFSYFANGFYYNTKDSAQVEDLFGQLVITEDEVDYLSKFASKYNERCIIYAKNKTFFDEMCPINENVKEFAGELLKEKNVVDVARNNISTDKNDAMGILNSFINKQMPSNTNSNSMEKGMTLTRTKPGFTGFDEDAYLKELEQRDKFGMAGFASIVLIIGAILFVGIGLGIVLLG